jgi:hypothetical protein
MRQYHQIFLYSGKEVHSSAVRGGIFGQGEVNGMR